jgi:hypothetical protein
LGILYYRRCYFNTTVFDGALGIIDFVINVYIYGLLQDKLEVVPEFLCMANLARHKMSQLVDRDVHDHVHINQFVILLLTQAQYDFFALVDRVRCVAVLGASLAYVIGIKVLEEPLYVGVVGMSFLEVLYKKNAVFVDLSQHVSGLLTVAQFAYQVIPVINLGLDILYFAIMFFKIKKHDDNDDDDNKVF